MNKCSFSSSSLARTAALALVLLASGLTTTAYADDEYGTHHETLIRQAASGVASTAASSKQIGSLYEQFAVGENINFASPGRDALIRKAAESGKSNATARTRVGETDRNSQ